MKGQDTSWQNLFALMRFRYIKVLFHIIYFYWARGNCSLHQNKDFVIQRFVISPGGVLWIYSDRLGMIKGFFCVGKFCQVFFLVGFK